jgi:hypothetical protein
MVRKKMPFSLNHLFLASLLILCLGVSAVGVRNVMAQKNPKPEDVAEKTILAYGSRAALYGVQHNGVLRALVKFVTPEGNSEGKSTAKFIRKQKQGEDLRMIELELPGTRYLIGFDGKETWTVHDGEVQKPSQQEINAFRAGHEHSYESLLRYKENNCQLEYVGSKNLGTFDLDIIDLVSPEGVRTRYEISRRSYRILYLSYEDSSDPKAAPVKYRLNFKDFRVIQNTLVPYETSVFQNGKLIEERKVVEAAFNVQLEEKAFKAENATKPAEATPGGN